MLLLSQSVWGVFSDPMDMPSIWFGVNYSLRDIEPTCTPEDRSLLSQTTYHKHNHHHRRGGGPQLLKVLKGLSWAGRCGTRKQRLLQLVL